MMSVMKRATLNALNLGTGADVEAQRFQKRDKRIDFLIIEIACQDRAVRRRREPLKIFVPVESAHF